MKILYINTAPHARIAGTDAVENEIQILQDAYTGERINVYPFRRPVSRLPLHVVGLQSISRLKRLDSLVDLHHVFSPILFPYPFLRFLRRPVVYSVGAGIDRTAHIQKWHDIQVVVGSERDLGVAKSMGLDSASLVYPGVDTSRFVKQQLPLTDDCILLSASAPWTGGQFSEKGFDLLFEAVSRNKDLRLVVLWRGLFSDLLMDAIQKFGIGDRVRVINEYTDISTLLPNVHGGIILASNPRIVRSMPHSMIETLAAGKPAIISDMIPMADYIRNRKCGCIVKDHSLESLEKAIRQFIREYPVISKNAMETGGSDFTREKMIEDYSEVYQKALLRDQ